MDLAAVGLVLVAAILHVGWNYLLKTAGDPLRTATAGVAVAAVALLPVAAAAWVADGMPQVPPEAVLVGVVSGVVEVGYFVLLSAAYRRGDLSLVYPLARGTAPLLAVAVGVGLLGERLAPAAWAGVVALLAGLLAVQRPWRLLGAAAAHQRPAAGFALATGVAIAAYSALDRVGVQLAPPLVYGAVLWGTCAGGLLALAAVRRSGAAAPAPPAAAANRATAAIAPAPARLTHLPGLPRAAAAGLMTVTAYGFVLAALSMAPLSAVAPLRESAIVLATLVGVTRLREGRAERTRSEVAWRLGGAVLIVVGAALIARG